MTARMKRPAVTVTIVPRNRRSRFTMSKLKAIAPQAIVGMPKRSAAPVATCAIPPLSYEYGKQIHNNKLRDAARANVELLCEQNGTECSRKKERGGESVVLCTSCQRFETINPVRCNGSCKKTSSVSAWQTLRRAMRQNEVSKPPARHNGGDEGIEAQSLGKGSRYGDRRVYPTARFN